jgi:hypothetical protein
MPSLKIKQIDSFKAFVSFFEDLHTTSQSLHWCRGCGKDCFELKPSLYRHNKLRSIESLKQLENDLIYRFQQRSIPFQKGNINNSWDWLFFMQHYGVPTRLLDWTESPLIALFFAVSTAPHSFKKNGTPVFNSDAAIWVLDPSKWNKHAVNLTSFTGKVLTTDDPNSSAYSPDGVCNGMKDFPIAIYGSHNSQRIVAQRGVFVCFGKDTRSMEIIYTEEKFPKNSLVKLVISKEKIRDFIEAIHRQGITESVVFPDLDGLAHEIKREFNFEV